MVETRNVRIVKEDAVLGGTGARKHTCVFGEGYDRVRLPFTISFCEEGEYRVIIKGKKVRAIKVE